MIPPKTNDEANHGPIQPLKLNPEAVPDLPGLDELELVIVQPAPGFVGRLTEGILIHVAGTAVAGGIGFVAGVFFATLIG